MKQLRITTRLIVVFLLLSECLTAYGQNEIHFYYKCRDYSKKPIRATITLKLPTNKNLVLFSDTISEYDFSKKNFFKTKGKYWLAVSLDEEKYGEDSVVYDFEINGKEMSTMISVSFDDRKNLDQKGNTSEKREKILNAYILVNKYYQAPKSVEISYDKSVKPDIMYDKPFFRIKNNSKDTVYGTRLPGYFWGKLSYMKNDSVLSTREGTIDELFADSPPIYPDSSKIATVGSFGFSAFRKSEIKDYRFEVWYKTKWTPRGRDILLKHRKEFYWWAETTDYYKLTCDFEIYNQTPNR